MVDVIKSIVDDHLYRLQSGQPFGVIAWANYQTTMTTILRDKRVAVGGLLEL